MTFQCDPQIIQCVFFAGEDLPQEICGIGGDWGNGSGMAEVGNLIQKLPDVIQIICQAVPALPGADLGMRGRHKLQFTDNQGMGLRISCPSLDKVI